MNMENRRDYPMLSWLEIQEIVETNRLELLGRSNDQQKHYIEFLEAIKNEYETVGDSILITKFHRDYDISLSGKKKAQTSVVNLNQIILVKNDFPYNFEAGKSYVTTIRISFIL